MQNPTGRQRPTHPVPRPRPDGPADLGILAADLDHLAEMHHRGHATAAGPAGPGYTGRATAPGDYATAQLPTGYAGLEAEDDYSDVDADADPDEAPWADELSEAEPAGPIFVDASGRRRKLARRASVAAVAVVAGYAGLLAVSFAGGPIPPNTLLPVPGIPSAKAPAPASTSVAGPGGPTSSNAGSAEHPAAAGRSTGGTSQQRPETHSGSTTTKPGTVAPSTPQPTSASTAPAPTAPTTAPSSTLPSASSTSHGNPTPGHGHKSSPGPTA